MNPLRKMLTRTVSIRGPRGHVQEIEVPPSQKLLYGIYFAFVALITLATLEALHLLVVKSFNSEIFSAISLVIGTILGAFFSQKT